jgi:hypothetical protein
MSVETPIGEFFEVMYQTGLYWQFIGFAQVLAGVLLLIPRRAHLGAFLFVPIMANIFVITVSLQFSGTPFVTGMMFLAVLYLSAWDYHRIRGALTERLGFAVFAASLLAVFLTTRSLAATAWMPAFMILGVVAGLLTLVRFLWVGRRLVPDRGTT